MAALDKYSKNRKLKVTFSIRAVVSGGRGSGCGWGSRDKLCHAASARFAIHGTSLSSSHGRIARRRLHRRFHGASDQVPYEAYYLNSPLVGFFCNVQIVRNLVEIVLHTHEIAEPLERLRRTVRDFTTLYN